VESRTEEAFMKRVGVLAAAAFVAALLVGSVHIETDPALDIHLADSAFAQTCSPRSPVRLSVSMSGARLLATVTAGTGALRELRFETARNARIDVGTIVGSPGGISVLLPERPARVAFSARQARIGSFTVPFVVVDDCGDWPTFVGAGSAFGIIQ